METKKPVPGMFMAASVVMMMLAMVVAMAGGEAKTDPVLGGEILQGSGEPLMQEILYPTIALEGGAPSSPRDLRAIAGDNVVHLSWTKPSELNGAKEFRYIIQRSYDGSNWKNLTYVDGDTSRFEDIWVANGLTISYRIVAVGDGQWSSPSKVSVASPKGKPMAPWTVKGSLDGSSVVITWSAPIWDAGSPVNEYIIYRKTDMDDRFVEVARSNSSVTSYVDTGVQGNRSAAYYIVARNGIGRSDPSGIVEVQDIPAEVKEGTGIEPTLRTMSIAGAGVLGIMAISAMLLMVMRLHSRKVAMERAKAFSIAPYRTQVGTGQGSSSFAPISYVAPMK